MLVCASDTMVSVCMPRRACMRVCVSFFLLSFKLSLGCVFSPHYVNQGGVQKVTPQVTFYEPHTAEESLRRRRSGGPSSRYGLVMRTKRGNSCTCRFTSTTLEGLCQGAPAEPSCGHLARSPHLSTSTFH